MLEIEEALSCLPAASMSIYQDDIAQAVRPAIREQANKIREEIHAMKEHYGLEPQVVSNRGRIWTKLILLSIDLTEATSPHLRAYGAIPEEEKEPLDERVGNLIALVEEMKKILR